MSTYVYALNRPTVLVDPSGMTAVWNNDRRGCTGFRHLECVSEWLKQGRPIRDYVSAIREDPAQTVVGTSFVVGGMLATYAGWLVAKTCWKQTGWFEKANGGCGISSGGLLGGGPVAIGAGMQMIKDVESRGKRAAGRDDE